MYNRTKLLFTKLKRPCSRVNVPHSYTSMTFYKHVTVETLCTDTSVTESTTEPGKIPLHSIKILMAFQGSLYKTDNKHENSVAYSKNCINLRLNSLLWAMIMSICKMDFTLFVYCCLHSVYSSRYTFYRSLFL